MATSCAIRALAIRDIANATTDNSSVVAFTISTTVQFHLFHLLLKCFHAYFVNEILIEMP